MTEESMLAPEECAGQRLDKAISEMLPSVSRSMAQKLIGEGSVILNGKTAGKSDKVRSGDEITVFDRGRIVQKGTHETLLRETGGKYRELWDAQAQYYRNA